MVLGVMAKAADVFKACIGESSEERRMESRLVSLGAGEKWIRSVPEEKRRVRMANRCKQRR